GPNGESILRYANGRWHEVTNPALTGLRFDGIVARSPSNVWVSATKADNSTGARLLHLRGTDWTAHRVPWQVHLRVPTSVTAGGGLSADGSGGFWFPTESLKAPFWMLHFRDGRWNRVRLTSLIERAALIPATKSLWGTGQISKSASSIGTIWAHGRVG
ncbi:MAG: hypothetical protein LBV78_26010, partial [Kitasatospora sp.]|nr:hypothetical protein [Kitasatospora sp.]